MTQEQLAVLNIIRSNPYFCKNEVELKQRTYEIKTDIENMLPILEAKLNELGPINESNQELASHIVHEEMDKVLCNNHNAIIVKANIGEDLFKFIDTTHQVYLIYYFQPDTIEPYMVLMSVDRQGIIHFYTPPLFLVESNNPSPQTPLNNAIGQELCHILKIPTVLLDKGPESFFKMSA